MSLIRCILNQDTLKIHGYSDTCDVSHFYCRTRTRPLSSYLHRISLVKKGLIRWKRNTNLSCETQQVVPNEKDSAILLARVANHSAGLGSSCRCCLQSVTFFPAKAHPCKRDTEKGIHSPLIPFSSLKAHLLSPFWFFIQEQKKRKKERKQALQWKRIARTCNGFLFWIDYWKIESTSPSNNTANDKTSV